MAINIKATSIYHITDVENLPSILAKGGLMSDVALAAAGLAHEVIGYSHIKHRRMHELRIACCGNRFVGEFVPFYFCPRSPMLYTLNRGNTGKPAGCQRTVIHLVSTVSEAVELEKQWAISDGNAGSGYSSFYDDTGALDDLDWDAIRARYWAGCTNAKSAEFLIEDHFPWTSIQAVGCHNDEVKKRVLQIIEEYDHRPHVITKRDWYY
jgi:hypothetical protein